MDEILGHAIGSMKERGLVVEVKARSPVKKQEEPRREVIKQAEAVREMNKTQTEAVLYQNARPMQFESIATDSQVFSGDFEDKLKS